MFDKYLLYIIFYKYLTKVGLNYPEKETPEKASFKS